MAKDHPKYEPHIKDSKGIIVGENIDVGGIHFHEASPRSRVLQDEAEYYYSVGLKHLERRSYKQAIKAFKAVLEREPDIPDIYYYLALSMLHGKRPKLLSLATIRSIEELLRTATGIDSQCGHAYALWAVVKYDYYVMNGMYERNPTAKQLLSLGHLASPTHVNEIVTHIQAPNNQVCKALLSW